MSINQKPLMAITLVGIVVAGVVLSQLLSDTSAAGYIVPSTVVLCMATAWFFARSSIGRRGLVASDSGASEKRKRMRALLKGFLLLLLAIAWGVAVAFAVRAGVVSSDEKKILWLLVPSFALMAIAMVYLFLGVSSDFDRDSE